MYRLGYYAAAAIAASSIIFAPTAQADTPDQTFVAVLAQDGIGPSGSQADMVATGHEICTAIQGGADPVAMAQAVIEANNGNISTQQGAYVVVAAIKILCPDQASKLETTDNPPAGTQVA